MGDDASAYLADWEFHQATGMVSVHIGTHDMREAAKHLIAFAAWWRESPHDTAYLIVGRQLRLGAIHGGLTSVGPGGASAARHPGALVGS